MNQPEITAAIKKRCKEKKISQKKLGLILGKNPSTVHSYLRGDKDMRLCTLLQILQAIGLQIHIGKE